MQQPAIARLEAGDYNPSMETLMRLSQGLGIDFHIDITPEHVEVQLTGIMPTSVEDRVHEGDPYPRG